MVLTAAAETSSEVGPFPRAFADEPFLQRVGQQVVASLQPGQRVSSNAFDHTVFTRFGVSDLPNLISSFRCYAGLVLNEREITPQSSEPVDEHTCKRRMKDGHITEVCEQLYTALIRSKEGSTPTGGGTSSPSVTGPRGVGLEPAAVQVVLAKLVRSLCPVSEKLSMTLAQKAWETVTSDVIAGVLAPVGFQRILVRIAVAMCDHPLKADVLYCLSLFSRILLPPESQEEFAQATSVEHLASLRFQRSMYRSRMSFSSSVTTPAALSTSGTEFPDTPSANDRVLAPVRSLRFADPSSGSSGEDCVEEWDVESVLSRSHSLGRKPVRRQLKLKQMLPATAEQRSERRKQRQQEMLAKLKLSDRLANLFLGIQTPAPVKEKKKKKGAATSSSSDEETEAVEKSDSAHQRWVSARAGQQRPVYYSFHALQARTGITITNPCFEYQPIPQPEQRLPVLPASSPAEASRSSAAWKK